MKITGKLVEILALQTGSGRNGEWKKQDIIIETSGEYPKKVCIAIWGDKINTAALSIGNDLDIDFDIESRSYNDRWYTDVKAWKVSAAGENAANPPSDNRTKYNAPTSGGGGTGFTAAPISGNDDDVLPF